MTILNNKNKGVSPVYGDSLLLCLCTIYRTLKQGVMTMTTLSSYLNDLDPLDLIRVWPRGLGDTDARPWYGDCFSFDYFVPDLLEQNVITAVINRAGVSDFWIDVSQQFVADHPLMRLYLGWPGKL